MRKTLCGVLVLGLVTQVLGQQEEFIGIWENTRVEGGSAVTVRVEFEPDGRYELTIRSTTSREAFLQAGEEAGGEGGEDPGSDLTYQIYTQIFPDTLALSVDASGTWEIDGDSSSWMPRPARPGSTAWSPRPSSTASAGSWPGPWPQPWGSPRRTTRPSSSRS